MRSNVAQCGKQTISGYFLTRPRIQRKQIAGESEEQQNEREMTFDAKHKEVVASDMTLATSWRRRRDSNPRDPLGAYMISNHAPSTN